MQRYIDRHPTLRIADPLHPGWYKEIRNPQWQETPEIISFSQFLKWNYERDYGAYIRREFAENRLELDTYTVWELGKNLQIKTVCLQSGKYDRIDEDSFFLYIYCDVVFVGNGKEEAVPYCVAGIHRCHSIISSRKSFL